MSTSGCNFQMFNVTVMFVGYVWRDDYVLLFMPDVTVMSASAIKAFVVLPVVCPGATSQFFSAVQTSDLMSQFNLLFTVGAMSQ
jgi:hypothetical protein